MRFFNELPRGQTAKSLLKEADPETRKNMVTGLSLWLIVDDNKIIVKFWRIFSVSYSELCLITTLLQRTRTRRWSSQSCSRRKNSCCVRARSLRESCRERRSKVGYSHDSHRQLSSVMLTLLPFPASFLSIDLFYSGEFGISTFTVDFGNLEQVLSGVSAPLSLSVSVSGAWRFTVSVHDDDEITSEESVNEDEEENEWKGKRKGGDGDDEEMDEDDEEEEQR